MSGLAAIARRVIAKVAKARKASPLQRQEIEDEFDRKPAAFARKYAKHLSKEERELLRSAG
jgi:hypothetical protein